MYSQSLISGISGQGYLFGKPASAQTCNLATVYMVMTVTYSNMEFAMV